MAARQSNQRSGRGGNQATGAPRASQRTLALRVAVRHALLRESESREHIRLKNVLRDHAESLGFDQPMSLSNGRRPDVLMSQIGFLFLADANVAKNETPNRSETVEEVYRYVGSFAQLLGLRKIRGGVLGIATNSRQAAEEWATTLNVLCRIRGWRSTQRVTDDR